MISVELERRDRKIHSFYVTGHAGYAEYGQDIVCSAVVAVVYGALGALEELCGLNQYEDVSEGEADDYVRFEMPPDVSPEIKEKASIILETMLIGLKQIEFVYSEYVSIKEQEVGP